METLQQILEKYWGYKSFRPMQEDIIHSVLEGKDTLALLPTGGGKSICYQVPGLSQKGICLVISPLIALMKDQVDGLRKRGINAEAIFSGMTYTEIDIKLDNCVYGEVKFLYLSPERLSDKTVQERLKKMKVNLIAVDEAHCISQWGYDFRPSYLTIAGIREIVKAPIIALTATATPDVKKDIQEKLLFKKENLFQKSFERKNLSYVVLHEEDKVRKLIDIIQKVRGSGIVYVRSRKRAKDISDALRRNRIQADFYHAGLDSQARADRQDAWLHNQIQVIVSTNAFGMGIDKPDVRFVVHLDFPDNPEAYYQEAGRAGRDEKKSFAVLMYDNSDILEAEKRLELTFPELQEIRNVYQCLSNYFQLAVGAGEFVTLDFDIAAFSAAYNLTVLKAHSCLHLLELEGLLSTSEGVGLPSRLKFTVGNEDLYSYQVKNPSLDLFIKGLLRSYEGLFDDFRKINEADIARRNGMPIDKVEQLLRQLQKESILNYLPRNESPQITFLKPREDVRHLKISTEYLEARKTKYRQKLDAMIRYVTNTEHCRSQVLLTYFEEVPGKCGICDVCLKARDADLSDEEFRQISQLLKVALNKEALSLKELVSSTGQTNDEKVIRVIQLLIDKGELRNTGNLIQWLNS